jgi:hypothetical protein
MQRLRHETPPRDSFDSRYLSSARSQADVDAGKVLGPVVTSG